MTDRFPKSVPDAGSYEGNDAAWPAELRVFQAEGRIEIDFTDGKSCSLPAEYLRVESPSAEVQGHGGPATRKVVPDWAPYAADLEPTATSVDRSRLIGALRAFFADQPVRIDWKAIEETADDRLIVSLAMLCPFEAAEKQILLEAASPSERARVMIALLESAALSRSEGDGPPVRH